LDDLCSKVLAKREGNIYVLVTIAYQGLNGLTGSLRGQKSIASSITIAAALFNQIVRVAHSSLGWLEWAAKSGHPE
jgi:hypothetical protein